MAAEGEAPAEAAAKERRKEAARAYEAAIHAFFEKKGWFVVEFKKGRPPPFWTIRFEEAWERDRFWDWMAWQLDRHDELIAFLTDNHPLDLERRPRSRAVRHRAGGQEAAPRRRQQAPPQLLARGALMATSIPGSASCDATIVDGGAANELDQCCTPELVDTIKAEAARLGGRSRFILDDDAIRRSATCWSAPITPWSRPKTPGAHCAKRPRAILLDLGRPDRDGLAIIPLLRTHGDAVILVVSAREAIGKVAALDLGAEDFVTKPFDTDELLARLRVALRQKSAAPGLVGTVIANELGVGYRLRAER